ncbi:SRPBCC family protein [Methylomonas sp. LL1]|uniref:SRPBCC family protein n=1 Tax=Methylomonas sp. LL1 TaxID=2785785 RepID=UPI0018C388D3|nr:SRPBCC family protein [Methylomonas sp. LL1]QPK64002.1 SRPBCC family protein [Methylomonas sp. LL1]
MTESILIAIVLAVIGILVYVGKKPDDFQIQRSITINATAEKIFPMINDLRISQTWSAWEKVDPGMQRRFDGPASGIGAKYAWSGNREIGQGEMEIALSSPNTKVRYHMHFIRPFEGRSDIDFDLSENGGQTRVTQTMRGKSAGILPKLMCALFFDQDKMIGGKFEQGLAALKTLMEA